jgi:hypothetical protein
MSYRPRRPTWSTYHRNWRYAYVANSRYGSVAAKRRRKRRIDNDGQRSIDFEWINEHGAPSRFWFAKGDRAKEHTAAELMKRSRVVGARTYPLRSAAEAFRDNAAHDVGTEWEVKDLRPISDEQLDAMMADLAADAQAAYGPDWHEHVVVKVLTDLGGGLRYALRICRAAHAHDIPTMLLVRGRARWRRFVGHTEITYVRGSRRRFPK